MFTSMINLSLQSGRFAEDWKVALVTSLLKKPVLEQIKKNLRPVSNLANISKLTESAVALQLQDHMLEHDLYPTNQSSYRRFHSTETALLKVRNDILQNMNQQRITLLVLLDFNAAFDTVNHSTLLGRLQSKLGLRGTALAWLKSYLSGRSQRIVVNGKLSRKFPLNCGVPQGSCLGLILFNIYVSSLFEIIDRHFPDAYLFADDLQLYLSFSPSSSADEDSAILAMHNCVDDIKNLAASNGLTLNENSAILAMQNCLADIKNCATSNGLMLNDDKTEFVVIGT